jgi:predicted ATPase
MVVGTSARDYRGFEELEFSSWSGVNLLIGQNGAGKSALLRLIATGLCRFAQQLSAVDSPI